MPRDVDPTIHTNIENLKNSPTSHQTIKISQNNYRVQFQIEFHFFITW